MSPTSAKSTMRIFKQLDEMGYDGWVGCEYRPLQNTAAGLTWLNRLLDRRPAAVPGGAD